MSLRLRLLLGLGLVAIVLVGAAVVVTRSTRADLLAKADEQLRTVGPRADGRGGPGPAGAGGVSALLRSTVWFGEIENGAVTTRVAPRTVDGATATPRLTDADIAFLASHPDEPRTVAGDGVARYRAISFPARGDRTWIVGAPLDDVDSSSRRLLTVEIGATAAGAIAGGDLSRRVPEADPRTEAGELGTALNTMLGRIEEAFAEHTASEERLRRFVADASHELRTPITTIRGYAELHRRGGLEDPDDRRAAMERTEQEAVRMGVLVDDLLLLARLDQGRPLEREPVDLARIVIDGADDATVSHPDHPVEAHIEGLGSGATSAPAAPGDVGGAPEDGNAVGAVPAEVVGDDHRLRQVVANLVGNAVVHTPAGTHIVVALDVDPTDEGRLRLTVSDDGPGMRSELADRAFERFARGDAARSRAAGSRPGPLHRGGHRGRPRRHRRPSHRSRSGNCGRGVTSARLTGRGRGEHSTAREGSPSRRVVDDGTGGRVASGRAEWRPEHPPPRRSP